MELCVGALAQIDRKERVSVQLRLLKENLILLTKNKFQISVELNLQDNGNDYAFDVYYGLDNISGRADTSKYLAKRLRQLLLAHYTVKNENLKSILLELNKGLRFTIRVLGSVHEFNSFSLVFKTINYALDHMTIKWNQIVLPLNLDQKPNYLCYTIKNGKLVGSPHRNDVAGNAPLVVVSTKNSVPSLLAKIPHGLEVEQFCALF